MELLTDKMRTVAVWAGATEFSGNDGLFILDGIARTLSNGWSNSWPILTDLNILHPIAMRVVSELCKTTGGGFKVHMIELACGQPPNDNGEYINLFNSVYDGVVLLEKIKTEQI